MSLALEASRTLNGSAGVESEPKPSKICFSVSLSSAFGFSFSWIIGFDESARSRIRTLPGTPPWMLFRLRPRNPIWPTMSSVPVIFASAEKSVALGTRKMRSLSVVPAPGGFRSTPSFRCQSKLGATLACAPTESTLVRPTPFNWSAMLTCAFSVAQVVARLAERERQLLRRRVVGEAEPGRGRTKGRGHLREHVLDVRHGREVRRVEVQASAGSSASEKPLSSKNLIRPAFSFRTSQRFSIGVSVDGRRRIAMQERQVDRGRAGLSRTSGSARRATRAPT